MKRTLRLIKKIPPPGFRNIKTAIAVFISLIFYSAIGREGAIFAVMAVLICMQDSVEKSITEGINRTIGTVIGGIFGIVFIYVFAMVYVVNIFWYYIGITVGLVILIHICNITNIKGSVVIASIVYLVIIMGAGDEPVMYSINRTIDTTLGIVLAVLVNRFMFKPKHIAEQNISNTMEEPEKNIEKTEETTDEKTNEL